MMIFDSQIAETFGLSRGTVALTSSHEFSKKIFIGEAERLEPLIKILGASIEHVGSTAVPNLPAKPIIDIAFGLATSTDIPCAIDFLIQYDYNYFGNLKGAGGHVFDRLVNGRTCFILHLLERNSFRWRKYIIFREYLKSNEEARQVYANGKIELAATFAYDRRSYTNAKRRIVVKLEREAFRWHRGRGEKCKL